MPQEITCGYCKQPIKNKKDTFAMLCLPDIVCFAHASCIPNAGFRQRLLPRSGDQPYINRHHRKGIPALNSKFYLPWLISISTGTGIFFVYLTGSTAVLVFLIPPVIFFLFPRIYYYYKFERHF